MSSLVNSMPAIIASYNFLMVSTSGIISICPVGEIGRHAGLPKLGNMFVS